eukprot:TRINITY_DN1193_c0_g1_i1.p1 TRINITY_DN1193_c0_g1~~TRINITY_DN1193_c0_g1_i1.p1  ORF type:complete len:858 (-),score=98.20 TRINITY_DN1193_c0_g1_i1:118-2691(-)
MSHNMAAPYENGDSSKKKRRNRKKQRKRRQKKDDIAKESNETAEEELNHIKDVSFAELWNRSEKYAPPREGAVSAPPILRDQNFLPDPFFQFSKNDNVIRETYSPRHDSPPPAKRRLPRNFDDSDLVHTTPYKLSSEDLSQLHGSFSSDSEVSSSVDDLSSLLQQSVSLLGGSSFASFEKLTEDLLAEVSPNTNRRGSPLAGDRPLHPISMHPLVQDESNFRYSDEMFRQNGYHDPAYGQLPMYKKPFFDEPSQREMSLLRGDMGNGAASHGNALYARSGGYLYPFPATSNVQSQGSPMPAPRTNSDYNSNGNSSYYSPGHQRGESVDNITLQRRMPRAKSNVATVPCRYFMQGYCSRGFKCSFSHDVNAVDATPDGSVGYDYENDKKVKTHKRSHSSGFPRRENIYNTLSINPSQNVHNTIQMNQMLHMNGNGHNALNGLHLNGNSTALRDTLLRSPALDSNPLNPLLASDHEPSLSDLTSEDGGNFLDLNLNLDLEIEQFIGQIYPMCKDQYGCRFLQKKLDEEQSQRLMLQSQGDSGYPAPEVSTNDGDAESAEDATKIVDIIFVEVFPHFGELMMDPFGNYLCQKLLEYCSDDQRLRVIESVSRSLSAISQNMHGTRAVQKMIECLNNSNVKEIRLVTNGLSYSVVALIKDLNGNHVIQRCLNHLAPQFNQFIYDAVAGHCIEVATHRHGCCVLQRCIDHANESQRYQLVAEIARSALPLVKDPYGNYVVQYVLDLPYPNLIAQLVKKLGGHLVELSTQKFSSNVVEKCLMVGNTMTRSWMIVELIESGQLEMLIQDPFGNYVIQTAMNISDPTQHQKLVEGIKPHLHTLRNTPYGKRIQNKILKTSGRRKAK